YHDPLEQNLGIHWFREVLIKTRLTAALHIVLLAPPGQCDQTRVAPPRQRSKASRPLVPAQIGHPKIEQYHRRLEYLRDLDRGAPLICDPGLIAGEFQKL